MRLSDDAWNEGLSVNATEHAHDLVHARFARLLDVMTVV